MESIFSLTVDAGQVGSFIIMHGSPIRLISSCQGMQILVLHNLNDITERQMLSRVEK